MIALTGIIYPFVVTAIATLTMQNRASGSLLITEGEQKIIGSKFIAQKFTSDRYFWPRPSACDYDAEASAGSNLGPTSSVLKKAIDERKAQIRKAHELAETDPVPNELLFASGSGLDPDISPKTAYFQIARVAKARQLDPEEGKKVIKALVDQCIRKRRFGFLGKPAVNVLELNMALDAKIDDSKLGLQND